MFRRLHSSRWLLGPALLLTTGAWARAQEPTPTASVAIYTDMPAKGQPDRRGEAEKYFAPFFFAPQGKASDIVSNPYFESSKLKKDDSGSCLELRFLFDGPNQWAQVGFFPAATVALGDTPARTDIETTLNPGPKDMVYLEFKARRPANEQSVVSFRSGGLAGSGARDGILPPAKRDPDYDELTADWTVYRIDLTEYKGNLDSVLCPFSVTCESNRNPRAIHRPKRAGGVEQKVTVSVYVDSIRFIKVPER